jgi:hypothetical protein
MKRYPVLILILAMVGALIFVGIKLAPQGLLSLYLKGMATPTTVTVNGPVILDAIHNLSRLETVSMVITNDQDISKVWGFGGLCQESLTYLGYYTVTAGVDLQNMAGTDIILEGGGTPAQNAVTLRLRPAQILHVELDTQQSRVVHSDVSLLSQLCGTQLPAMVLEAQTNLEKIAEASALQQGIIKMAQDRASFELQKTLVQMGFTNVTVTFNESFDDQPN